MGLFNDWWRNKRVGREEVPPDVTVSGNVDPEALQQIMRMFGTGTVTDSLAAARQIAAMFGTGQVQISHESHTIDATGNPELRAAILDALKSHGIDVETMQQQAAAAAGDQASPPPPPAAPPPPPGAPPPTSGAAGVEAAMERLRRIDELHAGGAITDDERAKLRQRILESL